MAVPHKVAIGLHCVDHSTRTGEHAGELAPTRAHFLGSIPLEGALIAALVVVPDQHAVIPNGVDHAITATEQRVKAVPSVADSLRRVPVEAPGVAPEMAIPVE